MILEQHSSLLSSGAENCFSFLVSRLVSEAVEGLDEESLITVAQVQQASAAEEDEDMTGSSVKPNHTQRSWIRNV